MGDGFTGTLTQQQQVTMAATTMTAGGLIIASQTTAGAAVITSAGTTITVGVTSAGAALSSIGASIAGVLASIPVAGWIALAVIAVIAAIVAIVVYWDEICEFFSGLWDSFWNWFKATIVYDVIVNTAVPWVLDTADQVWQAVATAADKVKKKYNAGMKRLAIGLSLATATRLLPRDEAVYLIRMIRAGSYDKLKWGLFPGKHNYPTERGGDNRYKYGTTKNGINGRYVAGSYIMSHISSIPANMSDEYVATNLNFYEARMVEKRRIYAYFLKHLAYPPGNSKLG